MTLFKSTVSDQNNKTLKTSHFPSFRLFVKCQASTPFSAALFLHAIWAECENPRCHIVEKRVVPQAHQLLYRYSERVPFPARM